MKTQESTRIITWSNLSQYFWIFLYYIIWTVSLGDCYYRCINFLETNNLIFIIFISLQPNFYCLDSYCCYLPIPVRKFSCLTVEIWLDFLFRFESVAKVQLRIEFRFFFRSIGAAFPKSCSLPRGEPHVHVRIHSSAINSILLKFLFLERLISVHVALCKKLARVYIYTYVYDRAVVTPTQAQLFGSHCAGLPWSNYLNPLGISLLSRFIRVIDLACNFCDTLWCVCVSLGNFVEN